MNERSKDKMQDLMSRNWSHSSPPYRNSACFLIQSRPISRKENGMLSRMPTPKLNESSMIARGWVKAFSESAVTDVRLGLCHSLTIMPR